MSMSKREMERESDLWVPTTELARSPGHPFNRGQLLGLTRGAVVPSRPAPPVVKKFVNASASVTGVLTMESVVSPGRPVSGRSGTGPSLPLRTSEEQLDPLR